MKQYKKAWPLTALLFLSLWYSQAFASGAKLPTIATTDANNPTATQTMATDGIVGTSSTVSTTTVTGGSDTGNITPIAAPPTVASKYAYLDPGHEIPALLLSTALLYFDAHQKTISNKNFLGLIDFKQHNSKERFYIIDLETGKVDKYLVAHGKNSDPDFDGYATLFSNAPGSEESSIGFYVTAETYEGAHGYSLKLDGLSSTNSMARSRAIVIHPADYVTPGDKIGRSWGCFALEPRFSVEIIDQIKGGVLIYATNVY